MKYGVFHNSRDVGEIDDLEKYGNMQRGKC
jgi:hypothetical protein